MSRQPGPLGSRPAAERGDDGTRALTHHDAPGTLGRRASGTDSQWRGGSMRLARDILVRRGDRGPRVRKIQRLLMERGATALAVDGRFGPSTEAAVRAFQRQAKLDADGLVGLRTLAALQRPATASGSGVPSARVAPIAIPAGRRLAPAARSISDWPIGEVAAEILRRTGRHLPDKLADTWRAMTSEAALAEMAAFIAAAAVAHAYGAGEVADGVLLGMGVYANGMAAFGGLAAFGRVLATLVTAASDDDLEAGAEHLAQAIMLLGIAIVMTFLLKRSAGKSGAAADREAATNAESAAARREIPGAPERPAAGTPVEVEAAADVFGEGRAIVAPDGSIVKLPDGASMSNVEARTWYLQQEAKIPDLLAKDADLQTRAMQAHNLRNTYRTAARAAMRDREAAAMLDATNPNLTWEQVVEKYSPASSGDDLWRQIIAASQRSRSSVNEQLGVKPPGQ
jgi:peptidoglycan hydrolase-like protein with peptidoglycan-binding domain